jgi:cytochrome P450
MVQIISRVATDDVEVAGHRFAPGDHVLLLLGAANRDPARFPDPDRLDLARDDGAHLSFGHGMHHCLGAALARLEGQVVIGSLVARFPGLRLLTPGVRYREHLVLRGLTELRVAV